MKSFRPFSLHLWGKIICLILIVFSSFETFSQNSFHSIFNGENLDGWIIKKHPDDQSFKFWKVEGSCIVANSIEHPDHDYIWLYSEKEYDDFELKFQFKAFQSSIGNSGIQVRSRYDEKNFWLNGPQIDIHPMENWRTGYMWDETRGNQRWIFPDIPVGEWVDKSMRKELFPFYYAEKDNRWNEMKIRCEGTKIKAWLNGVLITDLEGSGILDDENHQQLQVGMQGHIAFQIHKNDALKILFRDVKIRIL